MMYIVDNDMCVKKSIKNNIYTPKCVIIFWGFYEFVK